MCSSKEPVAMFYFFSLLNLKKIAMETIGLYFQTEYVSGSVDGKITWFLFTHSKKLTDLVCLFYIFSSVIQSFLKIVRECRWSGTEEGVNKNLMRTSQYRFIEEAQISPHNKSLTGTESLGFLVQTGR